MLNCTQIFGKNPQYIHSICGLSNNIIMLIPSSTQRFAKVCYSCRLLLHCGIKGTMIVYVPGGGRCG